MAIAYRNGNGTTSSASTGITINKPSGVVSGDVMLAVLGYWSASGPVTAPSGWTKVNNSANSAATYSEGALY